MFTKAGQYGLRAVILLASTENGRGIMGVSEISKTLDIPKYFLAKVLQQLARQDIISSVRGPGGGFYLNDINRSKTLYDVIVAIEGDKGFEQCILGKSDCSNEVPCPLHFQAVASREGLFYQMKNASIEQFVHGKQISPLNV